MHVFSQRSQHYTLQPMPENSHVQLYSCLWKESLSNIHYSVMSGTENPDALLDLDPVECCLIIWLALSAPSFAAFCDQAMESHISLKYSD